MNQLLKNAVALATSYVSGRVIRLLYLLVIARQLGPAETAIYLYGVALTLLLVGLCTFGQNAILAERAGRSVTVTPELALRHSLVLFSAVTLLITFGLFVFIMVTESGHEYRLPLLFFGVSLAFRSSVFWVRGAFVALKDAAWIPKYETAFRLGEACIGTVVLLSGGGLLEISALHASFWILESIFAFRRISGRLDIFSARVNSRYLKKFFQASILVALSAAVAPWYLQSGVVLLRQLAAPLEFVGQFGIAMQFLTTLLIAPIALAQALLPGISSLYSSGTQGRNQIAIQIRLLIVFSCIASIFLAFFGPALIQLLFGDDYLIAGRLFASFSLCLFGITVFVFLTQTLSVMSAQLESFLILLGVVLVYVSVLIGLHGSDLDRAVVVSLYVSSGLGAAMACYFTNRKLGILGHSWWLKPMAVALVSVVVAGLLPSYVNRWLGAAISVAFAPVALIATGSLGKADLLFIRNLLRHRES